MMRAVGDPPAASVAGSGFFLLFLSHYSGVQGDLKIILCVCECNRMRRSA